MPIHVGDTAYTEDGDGFGIVQIIIDQDSPSRIVCSTGSGLDTMRLPSSVFHARPDSWKRIAAELEGLSVDSSDNYYVSTHCSELADRIRRLAAKEDK